jgi:hypothetical protein
MHRIGGAGWFARAGLAGALVLAPACEFDDAIGPPPDGSAGASMSASTSSSSAASSTMDTSSTSSTSSGSGGTDSTTSATGGSGGEGGAAGATSGGGSGGSATGSGGASGSGGDAGSGGTGGSGQAGSGGSSEDAGAVTTVDDSVVGAGPNQFEYVGNWKMCPNTTCTTATTPELYMKTNHWAGGADAGANNETVTFSFTGTRIYFYGVTDTRYGIGMASIDNGTEATVDFYATARAGNQLLWTSPVLASGPHTFKLRVTGMKNASSTDSTITVDRVDFR